MTPSRQCIIVTVHGLSSLTTGTRTRQGPHREVLESGPRQAVSAARASPLTRRRSRERFEWRRGWREKPPRRNGATRRDTSAVPQSPEREERQDCGGELRQEPDRRASKLAEPDAGHDGSDDCIGDVDRGLGDVPVMRWVAPVRVGSCSDTVRPTERAPTVVQAVNRRSAAATTTVVRRTRDSERMRAQSTGGRSLDRRRLRASKSSLELP